MDEADYRAHIRSPITFEVRSPQRQDQGQVRHEVCITKGNMTNIETFTTPELAELHRVIGERLASIRDS
jgi:hypothetical protein